MFIFKLFFRAQKTRLASIDKPGKIKRDEFCSGVVAGLNAKRQLWRWWHLFYTCVCSKWVICPHIKKQRKVKINSGL